jgi:hypothetical protein
MRSGGKGMGGWAMGDPPCTVSASPVLQWHSKELINNFKKISRDTVPLTVTFLKHSFLNCINMVYFLWYDPVFSKKKEITFGNSRNN